MGERRPGRESEPTTTELFERLAGQAARLVRQEAALVREESMAKAADAGMGAMLFANAGVLAVYGGGAVVAGVVLAVATELPRWAAALVVAGGLLAACGALALVGRRRLRGVLPLFPERTVERLKADIRVITERARR